ncbi:MAG TPA: N-acetylmuramoyl-L-alanine amidase [Candidatus Coprenecus stercoravium]|uniref:N-acetylmuramoyl-L-alanine amidase n=1 Tax=Candidatus Coprenecus stercoravium TaxID=2840735 RepID=A0A9D2K9Z8_9BACT|nr:N-acetylmuramoyl-L-alanine amidase [Candidatus Coprenecus stercoravium]
MKRLVTILILAAAIWPALVNAQNKQVVELKTVVIDAGHGGHDPGAINGKIYEKNITLSIAKRLGELIRKNYPSVKVIYTRDDDTFVELYKRADIANKNNADLFISIHVNSAGDRSARGHETFVMGQDKNSENFEICRTENSVIVLEEDYSSNYQGFDPGNPESYIIFSLLQNSHLEQSTDFATLIQQCSDSGPIANNRGVKQANFIVLWKCTMPAVLIELGFISNPNDIKALTDKNSQQRIAGNIFKAFQAYKKEYDTEIIISSAPDNKAPESVSAADGRFGVQIMASNRLLPGGSKEFKGWSCKSVKSGRTYKYYIGPYSSRAEASKALPAIRNSFPDAFIINLEK